jgi:hypothetical protein
MPRTLAPRREHPLDEVALGLGVGGAVVAEPHGQGTLQVGVGDGGGGVGAQRVAAGQAGS